VRELQNVIEQLVVLSEGDRITGRDVAMALRPRQDSSNDVSSPLTGLRDARRHFEREFITRTLEEHGWRIQDAAASLQIDRSHLWKKMRSLGIESPQG
jgi:DNA-binding NtrC family response regulator